MKLHGQKVLLLVEIKNVDRRLAHAQIKTQFETTIKDHCLDICPY
jgi:hypothetical protein